MPKTNGKYGLIVVSAPSGAGKSTLCTKLLKEHSDRLSLSISTTSRAPRGAEKNGVEYFFVTQAQFESHIQKNEFAEWANVHENYYGTRKATLQDFWNKKHHVLLDIDVQGAASLKKVYPDSCLTVFIAPPSLEVLEKRLRGRGTDAEVVIQKRMKNAIGEMAEQEKFDEVIVNDTLENAYSKLETIALRFMDQLERGTWPKQP